MRKVFLDIGQEECDPWEKKKFKYKSICTSCLYLGTLPRRGEEAKTEHGVFADMKRQSSELRVVEMVEIFRPEHWRGKRRER